MRSVRLSVVLLQYEVAAKYPRALAKLLATLDRLRSVEWRLVVVDNGRPGDWKHRIAHNALQVGGDNSAWEFSGFDRGLEVLDQWGPEPDLVLLVTDAFQAYGEEFLEMIDDRVVNAALGLRACVGWTDSFGREECRIGEHAYHAWLRSSFMFLPPEAVADLRPLAVELEALSLFGSSAETPFAPGARLSENLQRFLLEWLTTLEFESPRLVERWHSRFDLGPKSLSFFQAKVGSILREHLTSARLQEAGVPCYDFRCLGTLAEREQLDAFVEGGGDPELQWLGWREALGEPPSGGRGVAPPSILLAGEVGASQRSETAMFLLESVLPLIRQRYPDVRLLVAGGLIRLRHEPGGGADAVEVLLSLDAERAAGALDSCVAVVAPPGSEVDSAGAVRGLLESGLPLLAARRLLRTTRSLPGRTVEAETPVELAAACCRLIAERRTAT